MRGDCDVNVDDEDEEKIAINRITKKKIRSDKQDKEKDKKTEGNIGEHAENEKVGEKEKAADFYFSKSGHFQFYANTKEKTSGDMP
ncbi:MAG: hypothetical protein Q9M20_00555 [Mariprofundaceae bacterium]|nr:hypothetical protein [Mariprofundaceae bacterium]